MEPMEEVARSLGRIEGRMHVVEKLSERVTSLEMWQSWLKGGWAVLAAVGAYLFKISSGK